jgi:acetoin utilization deacetylase AcuC-like enzyme
LKLTMAGLARRDTMVFEAARSRGLPVAVAMAGGYGNQIEDTVAVHTQTIMLAARYHAQLAAERASVS